GPSSVDATISGSCLSDQATKLIDLAVDVVLHPAFPEDALSRYKQQTSARLTQQRANPSFLATEMFSRAVFGTHPAARVGPTLAAIDKMPRDNLAEFHRSHSVPDRSVLAVAGDVSMFQARVVLESKLSAWKKPAMMVTTAVTNPAPINGSKIYFIAR